MMLLSITFNEQSIFFWFQKKKISSAALEEPQARKITLNDCDGFSIETDTFIYFYLRSDPFKIIKLNAHLLFGGPHISCKPFTHHDPHNHGIRIQVEYPKIPQCIFIVFRYFFVSISGLFVVDRRNHTKCPKGFFPCE